MKNERGKVYLVGAGPGSVGYLTKRGSELLEEADIVVYDALVETELLQLVSPNCITLHVGKRGGRPSTPQAEINQLLVDYCLQGKQVVRLKSGDPFIFGRATSEIEALQLAGCDFEIIPGISSALAAPLFANIPLTDKILSSCFVVLSAHNPEALDWEAIARIDTLVILMGASNLSAIVQHLQGRSPSEKVAIIRNCGRAAQQVWRGTLTDIVELTVGENLSPAVIVIGKVVELSNKLINNNPSPLPPLAGKTVIITRAAETNSKFTNLLQQQGAKVIEMPALEITPPSSYSQLDRAIAHLKDFHWLLLTSANGVEYFCKRLREQKLDGRDLAGIKIAVVGKKTAAILQQYNLQPDFIPPDFVADSLVEHFPEALTAKKVLFPRVETGGREILVKELSDRGATVVEVAAYQSRCPEEISPIAWEAMEKRSVDIVTFASSKTVKNFYQLVEGAINSHSQLTPQSLLENVCIASIGPMTSLTCRQLLGRVDVEASQYTLEGLTEAIVHWSRNSS